MALKANYFKIGIFVLLGFALLAVVLVLWGAKALRRERFFIETYLNESVQGLTVGSQVNFRGVQIGEVTSIQFAARAYELEPGTKEYARFGRYIVVEIGLYPESFADPGEIGRILEIMVKEGFRFQLKSQVLTGLAYLEGDLLDPAANPPLAVAWEPKHPYVPAAPGMMAVMAESVQTFLGNLAAVDIEQLAGGLNTALASLNQALVDARVAALSRGLEGVMADARSLLKSPPERAAPATVEANLAQLHQTLATAEATIQQLQTTNSRLQQLLITADTKEITSINEVLAEMRETARLLALTLRTQSPLVNQTLQNLRLASENLNNALQELRSQPNQLLFSAPPPQSEVVK